MIDDKELEKRAESWVTSNMSWDDYECQWEESGIKTFIAGACSQDEVAYQRGRREVLERCKKIAYEVLDRLLPAQSIAGEWASDVAEEILKKIRELE